MKIRGGRARGPTPSPVPEFPYLMHKVYTNTLSLQGRCPTDASVARMCGGVAAATGISGAGEGPVEKVPLPHGGEGGTAGAWPPQETPPGDPRG